MINVSNSLKRACNNSKVSYREYIIIDGTTEEIDIKGQIYMTAYKDTHFIGTFNINYINFNTENNIDYKEKEFNYYKEVNGESFKVGHFIVTEVKDSDTKEEVTVTAYDNGLKFSNPYVTNLDYDSKQVKLFNVLQEICAKCNVQLENAKITNGDFIVDSNQFVNGEKFGDVVSAIAFMSGNFATINNEGKLELIFYKVTKSLEDEKIKAENNNYLITEDNKYITTDDLELIEDYVELEDKRDTRPITCVKLGWTDIDGGAVRKDEELISKYGENWLTINDCPFAYSSQKQEELIDAIFNKVKGFGYSAFTAKYAFKPYYQLGDLIKFKTLEGNIVKSIVLRIETNYDDITLSAPSVTNSTVEYDSPEPVEEQVKRASFEINQANRQIVLKVDENGNLVEVGLGIDAEEGSQFNVKADNINFESYNFNLTSENIKIESKNLLIDDNGNFTLNVDFYGSYNYSYFDLLLVVASVLSRISLDSYTKNVLDISNDGNLTISDLTIIKQILANEGEHKDDKKYVEGYVKINSDNPKNCLSVYDNTENPIVQIGVGGVNAMNITSQSFVCAEVNASLGMSSPYVSIDGVNGNVYATGSLTQGSSCNLKKNFEKIEDVMEIIENTDIYKYNLISEDDNCKKHYGIVIGDDYNYSQEYTSKNNDGIELYSMLSICFQAIKQLNQRIESLEKEIINLKGGNN